MHVPPISNFGLFSIRKNQNKTPYKISNQKSANIGMIKPIQDTVNFSGNAKYMKKYATLPAEVKEVLNPKDGIDMFKDIESIANGKEEAEKIGSGNSSDLFVNPYLKGYYILIVTNPKNTTQIVYSKEKLGNSIWSDDEDERIQLVKAG